MIEPHLSISLSTLNHSQLLRNPNSYTENSYAPTQDIRSYIVVQKTNELFLLIGEKKSQHINEKWLVSHLNKLKFALKKQIFFHAINTNQFDLNTQLFLSNEMMYSTENNQNIDYLNQNVIDFIKKIKLFTKNINEFNEKYNFLNISNLDKQLLIIEHKNIVELKKIISLQSTKKYYIPEVVRKINNYCNNLLIKEKIIDEDYIITIKKIMQIENLIKILNLAHQTITEKLFFHKNRTSYLKHRNDIECLKNTNKLINHFQDHLNELNKILLKNIFQTI